MLVLARAVRAPYTTTLPSLAPSAFNQCIIPRNVNKPTGSKGTLGRWFGMQPHRAGAALFLLLLCITSQRALNCMCMLQN